MRVRRGPPDAGEALARALERRLGSFAVTLHVNEISSRAWTSITFSGARLRLMLRIEGEDAGAAGHALRSIEAEGLELNGHVLADMTIVEVRDRSGAVLLTLDALTVEKVRF